MSHGSISHGSMQGDDTWNIKYELLINKPHSHENATIAATISCHNVMNYMTE